MVAIDEAKYVGKNLAKVRRAGKRNVRRVIMDDFPDDTRYNVILLTNLHRPDCPLFFHISDGKVNADVFLQFVEEACRLGFITADNVVIWDNCRVHTARHTDAALTQCIQQVGAMRVNLPKYSPEFNPPEYVIGYVKDQMRFTYSVGQRLFQRLVYAHQLVTHETLVEFYIHCMSVLDTCADLADHVA